MSKGYKCISFWEDNSQFTTTQSGVRVYQPTKVNTQVSYYYLDIQRAL